MFPAEYRDQIIIAEHGSWNRSVPQGYRLSLVKLEGNKVVSYTRFAEGWLRGMKPARGAARWSATSGAGPRTCS